MTDLREFEQDVREDLVRTAQVVQVPAGAIDRAIRAARDQELTEPIAVRRSAGWTRPLAAAAAVLLIVSGVALASHWPSADHDTRPTQRPTPVPTVTAPAPTTSSTPTGTGTKPSPGAPAVQVTRVNLGGATIGLPVGWWAYDVPKDQQDGTASWCLHASNPAPSFENCPIKVTSISPADAADLSPGNVDGLADDPAFCGDVTPQFRLLDQGIRQFGSRTADYRRSAIRCPDGTEFDLELYVIATAPAFVVYSEHADAAVHRAIATIAATSTLPAQSLPLPLVDSGTVTSIVHLADGYHITLRRADPYVAKADEQMVSYVIPDALVPAPYPSLKVGQSIAIFTNGRRVVSPT